MELDFQYLLLTMIISSVASYMFFACHYLEQSDKPYKLFIDHVVSFSSVVMIASALLVIKLIVVDYRNPALISLQRVSLFVCMLLLAMLLFAVSTKALKRERFIHPFSTVIIINLPIYSYFFMMPKSYSSYYNVMLFAYVLIVFRLTYRVVIGQRVRKNLGIYYIFIACISLVICHLVVLPFSQEMVLNIELALIVLSVVGLFIFYNNFYIAKMEEQMVKVQDQAQLLNEKNKQMKHLVEIDEVSQVQNRTAFEGRLEELTDETYIGLLNIKNFMNYNNLLGFSQGNELLRSIAKEIEFILPSNVIFYRFYSDKFLLIMEGLSKDEVILLFERINNRFESDARVGLALEMYFGLLRFSPRLYETSEEKINDVINSLEIASSEARSLEANFYEYTHMDLQNFRNTVNLELQLVKAISACDFEVYYQPQVDLKSLEIVAYEALVRWKLKDEHISPGIFIPMAEAKGLIAPITYFVIKRVFEDVSTKGWIKSEHVSINLSAMQLIEPELITYIEEMIMLYPGCHKHIIFEITETTLFTDIDEVDKNIRRLIDLGFQFSLDDFGAGYSSLYRFATLELNEVKFDKVFIQDLIDDPKLQLTLRKTVELFKEFGLRIVAEGIETKEQYEKLLELDIDILQGYYFYRPMPLERILAGNLGRKAQ